MYVLLYNKYLLALFINILNSESVKYLQKYMKLLRVQQVR